MNEPETSISDSKALDQVCAIETDKESGVAAIEFAMGFTAFWLMCVFLIEVSYVSYVSAVGDLLISQAARQSKLYSEGTDFLEQYKAVINENDSIWSSLVNKDNFQYSIRYVDSYDELSAITEACEVVEDEVTELEDEVTELEDEVTELEDEVTELEDEAAASIECGDAEDSPIAIYRISYDYDPIFNYFGTSTDIFSREMLVIQEYQRTDFEVGD